MSTAMLGDLEVTRQTYTCPECEKEGVTTTFTRPQSLGAHRRNAHGVVGTSSSSKNGKKQRKAKAAKPRRRQRAAAMPAPVSLAPVPPEQLTDREYSAFRLGSIQTLLAAIDEGRLDPPGQIFTDALAAEVEYHEWMLAAAEAE